MSETKHTPEKWTTSQYDEHPAMIVLNNGKEVETVIAYAYDKDVGKERQIANARLIAIAPELLEALEELSLWYCEHCDRNVLSCDECRFNYAQLIAEAKGEKQ